MNRLQFTEKEKAIILDVQRKNFWSKALPLSIGSMVACRVLMMRGYIGTNRALAKVIGCGFVGYIVGKTSTSSEIKEQLLKECPDGVFAKAYGLSPEERNNFLAELAESIRVPAEKDVHQTFPGETRVPATNETVSNSESPNTVPPVFSGGEDKSMQQPPANKLTRPVFSYAEQRASLNKSETGPPPPQQSPIQPEFSYAEQRSVNTSDSSGPLPKGAVQVSPTEIPVKKVRRNQYGDEME